MGAGPVHSRPPDRLAAALTPPGRLAVLPAVNAHIACVVRPNERAMAWALATFVLHLLGDMLSPPLFGIVSTGIGRRDTFAIFSLGIEVAGALCLLAARTAGGDVERARYRPLHDSRRP